MNYDAWTTCPGIRRRYIHSNSANATKREPFLGVGGREAEVGGDLGLSAGRVKCEQCLWQWLPACVSISHRSIMQCPHAETFNSTLINAEEQSWLSATSAVAFVVVSRCFFCFFFSNALFFFPLWRRTKNVCRLKENKKLCFYLRQCWITKGYSLQKM